jgi:hypothetical protein
MMSTYHNYDMNHLTTNVFFLGGGSKNFILIVLITAKMNFKVWSRQIYRLGLADL